MFPVNDLLYLREQNSESSEDEGSPSGSSILSADSNISFDSTTSGDLNSLVDLTSEYDFDVPVSSTTPERVANLTCPMSSSPPVQEIIPGPSSSTIPRMIPAQMSPVLSTSRGIQENSDDFRFETARRLSFRNWTISSIDPGSLAAAGLYQTGYNNMVKCFECGVSLMTNHWLQGHTPMEIHQMCSPQCRFVRNENCGNVPIGADPDKVLRKKRRNRNISCPYEHRHLRYARKPTAYELMRLGLKQVKKPKYMEYASYESRLESFATWPTYMTQTSEELAYAGYYYIGINDTTICYHCGIGRRNWRPDENPWEQHAISSPSCYYVLTIRGCEYVNNATGQELYERSTETPIQITIGNHETCNNENGTNEMSLVQKVAALEEENRALKDARSCKVCMDREATITFLPCGHLATCQYCSPAFTRCIICRGEIKAIVNTFFT